MRTALETRNCDPVGGGGVHLWITADESDPWEGRTRATRVGENQGIPVLFAWDVKEKATGKKKRVCFRLDTRPELQAAVEEWQAAQAAWERAWEQAKTDEKEAIRSGDTPITLKYHDGEHLSGFMAFGPAASLLKSIGLARDVDGWGTLVDAESVKALGETFTFRQAEAYARPALEAKAEKEAEAQATRDAILDRVKNVEIGRCRTRLGSDGEDLECSVTVTALDGRIYRTTFVNIFDGGLWTPRDWPEEVLAAAMEKLPADMKRVRI